jgi:hypothetical protein
MSLYCGICQSRLGHDDTHFEVTAEYHGLGERGTSKKYVICYPCFKSVMDGWSEAAE